ncbi:MAG TPA: glycosyltransferase family 4 protein [Verrucomicrobia bacterium]|nr:glycosyltransferase family 4 protein [Verrucomicrobiota bacterium]
MHTTIPSSLPSAAPSADWPSLSAVLCHDWLTGMRGGERVLELLCEGFPSAPIYTLLANPGTVSKSISSHPIHTSWLQHIPSIEDKYRALLPLFPAAIRSLHPPPAEVVISTSSCVAKSIIPHPRSRHLCYCFTPMRYAWTFYEEYFGGSPIKGLIARPLLAWLRRWDRRTADRVDLFVAISQHVRERIKTFYGREADVVYPPVDTVRCTPGPTAGTCDFDLIVSAMVPYKRIDLAIDAYNQLGYPLKIVGVGGKRAELAARAMPNITFEGWRSDDEVLALYRHCRLLIFPGEEDFGIVPLEAQACGKPVVAYGKGGALETVKPGVSGIFFDRQTPDALSRAIIEAARHAWDPVAIRRHAETFGTHAFIRGLSAAIEKCHNLPYRNMSLKREE